MFGLYSPNNMPKSDSRTTLELFSERNRKGSKKFLLFKQLLKPKNATILQTKTIQSKIASFGVKFKVPKNIHKTVRSSLSGYLSTLEPFLMQKIPKKKKQRGQIREKKHDLKKKKTNGKIVVLGYQKV